MKKAKIFTNKVLTIAVFLLLIASCKKEQLPSPTKNPTSTRVEQVGESITVSDDKTTQSVSRSSSSAANIIDESILRWNKYFGYSVQGVSSYYIGEISNESNRQSIVAAITNESAWAPYGNVANPKSVSAKRLKYFSHNKVEHLFYIDSLLEVGQSLYRIQWNKKGKSFYTLAVFDGNELVYDNMISNTMLPSNTKPVSTNQPSSYGGYGCDDPGEERWVKASWLWGSTRGEARIDVDLDCECVTGDCEVFTTTENNKAWFHIGSAEAKVKWMDSPNKDRCVKYAGLLLLKGPMATVSYSFDVKIGKFDVKVEGIGCHYTKTFTTTLCCGTTGCWV